MDFKMENNSKKICKILFRIINFLIGKDIFLFLNYFPLSARNKIGKGEEIMSFPVRYIMRSKTARTIEDS